jgi:hypothetical protein
MEVDLFYLSPNPYGGWVTYTSHLMKSLRSVGVTPNLFKVRPRTEKNVRPFGYGEFYRNLSLQDAVDRPHKKLIVAAAKNFRTETIALWLKDAGLVVHDPTELKNLPPDVTERNSIVVVRQIGLRALPKATFIRHPYVRVADAWTAGRDNWAISVSRVDFDKHTEILLEANRLLDKDRRISIRGFENRIYTRFKIVPHYPEWEQSKGHFDRNQQQAFDLLSRHLFNVDMSEIKGDGGGTQYTFLEAWDAGAINIINWKWMENSPVDDMAPGNNCLAVAGPTDLAFTLEQNYSEEHLSGLRNAGYNQLTLHHPRVIGEQYKAFIRGL